MDRIFGLVCPRYLERGARTKDTMVFVMSAGDGLLEKHIELVRESREVQGTYSTASLRRYRSPSKSRSIFSPRLNPNWALSSLRMKSPLRSFSVRTSSNQDLTVKEQRWEFEDGQKVKVKGGDKGVQVKKSELVPCGRNGRVRNSGEWLVCVDNKAVLNIALLGTRVATTHRFKQS